MCMSTKFSPFQLVYGIDPMLPIEYDIATIRTIEKERLPVEESISERLHELCRLDENRNLAIKSIEEAQEKQKKEYDKKCSKKIFEKGQLVLVYDSRHKKRAQHKFLP